MSLKKFQTTLLLILVFFINKSFSQTFEKKVIHEDQFWTQYSFLGKISDRFSIYFDGVDRFNDFFKSENTIFLRPGIAIHLTENTSFYVGYCYAQTYPTDDKRLTIPEHRPWQQLLSNQKAGKLSIQHRYRLEQRFVQNSTKDHLVHSYSFTWRFRYKLSLQYPLWKTRNEKNCLSIQVSDEIFTSFGKNVVLSYFNQNRIFTGFNLELNKSIGVSIGYTNIFRSTSTPGIYESINAPTININQKIDFRK